MKQKKTISFILAVLTAVTACVSSGCSNTDSKNNKSEETQIQSETSEEDTSAEDTQKMFEKDSLPEKMDFGQREFNVFTADYYGENRMFEGDSELTGDIVNDAVVSRNRNVEERLNVKINYHPDNSAYWANCDKIIMKYTNAGDPSIDLFLGTQNCMTRLVPAGHFIDCSTLDNLDFSKPWWKDEYMKEIMIDENARMLLAGDYFIGLMQTTFVLFFNKVLYNNVFPDYGDLYERVMDGSWTLVILNELAEKSYSDLNNNGKTDTEDQLGFSARGYGSTVDPFMYLAGIDFAKHEDNNITLNLFDERAVTLTEKVVQLFTGTGSSCEMIGANESEQEFDLFSRFKARKILFLGYCRLINAQNFKDMEDDYGFLPYPKLNEEQESYHSLVADEALAGGLSSACQNLDIAGAVLEALNSETYRSVAPVWYESALKVRYTRDNISSKMIDLIHDSYSTDFMYVYSSSLSDIGIIMRRLAEKGDSNYISAVTKKEKKVNSLLEKIVSEYYDSRSQNA